MMIVRQQLPILPFKLTRQGGTAGPVQLILEDEFEHSAGVIGPRGLSGSETSSFVYTQASADTRWTVNHNMNRYPLVEILSVGGKPVDAEITHVSLNQFTVDFLIPFAGKAIAR